MEPNTNNEQQAQQSVPPVAPTPTQSAPAANDGVSDNKLWAIVGYILPILFFIPMLNDSSKHNAFARFHANQQLILLIIAIAIYVVLDSVLYGIIGPLTYTIMSLLNLAMLALAIMGIINAAGGHMKELPGVGGFNVLDKLF